MAQTPDAGDKSTEAAPADEGVGVRGKRAKTSVVIDLPPSTVIEQSSTPAAEAAEAKTSENKSNDDVAASPAEPPPRSDVSPEMSRPERPASPKLVPALIGLVAGAFGGFGAAQINGYLAPAMQRPAPAIESRLAVLEQGMRGGVTGEIPAALVDRLSKAEAALAAGSDREKVLRDEISKLASGLTAEAGERAKALAALGERAGAVPAPAAQIVIPVPDANRDVEQIKARLGSVESAAGALPSAIGTVSAKADSIASRVDTLAPRLDQVNMRVETLAPKLESVGGQVTALERTVSGLANRDALARSASLVAATGVLAEAFNRGQPLGPSVGILRSLGVGAEALAAFQPFLEKGAPAPAGLLAELRAIRPTQAGAGSGDLMERMKQGALSLIEVRKTGEITGSDDPSQIAIAEQALSRGEIALALAAIAKLSQERAPAYAAWRSRAEQRLKAGEAVQRLGGESFAALRDAAAGSAKQ